MIPLFIIFSALAFTAAIFELATISVLGFPKKLRVWDKKFIRAEMNDGHLNPYNDEMIITEHGYIIHIGFSPIGTLYYKDRNYDIRLRIPRWSSLAKEYRNKIIELKNKQDEEMHDIYS